jgi:hypothetical protein
LDKDVALRISNELGKIARKAKEAKWDMIVDSLF